MSDELILHGLSQLEARELRRALRTEDVRIAESEPVGPGQQGDAAVWDLIAHATPLVVGVVGVWLLKPHTLEIETRRLSYTDKHGQKHDEVVRTMKYTDSALSDTVVQTLAKLFRWPINAVKDAIDNVMKQTHRR